MNATNRISRFLVAAAAAFLIPPSPAEAAPQLAKPVAAPMSKVLGVRLPAAKAAGVCTVPAPVLVVSPDPVVLPTALRETQSAPATVTIQNAGNAPLVVSDIFPRDPPCDCSQIITLADPNTCIGTPIAPGGSCAVEVSFFADSQFGANAIVDGALDFVSNDPVSPFATVPVQAPVGEGVLSFSTDYIDFGATATTVVRTVSLANNHAAALTVNVSPPSSGYTVQVDPGCPGTSFPMTMNPGATCDLDITFAPSSSGVYYDSVYFSYSDGSLFDYRYVDLSGTGISVGAGMQVDTTSLFFGSWAIGSISYTAYATVTNVDTIPHSVTGFSPVPAAPFVADASACIAASPLAPGSSCLLEFLLDATSAPAGAYSDSAFLLTDGGNASIGLSGNVVDPGAVLSVADIQFPPGLKGVPDSLVATATNTGTVPTQSGLLFTPSNADVTVDPGTCVLPLAAGASCTFTVNYSRATVNLQPYLDTIWVNGGNTSYFASVFGITLDTLPAAIAASEPGTVTLAPTIVDTDGVPYEISLANGGTDGSTLEITSIVSSSPEFLVASDCPLGPSTLSSQACCLATVTFHPTAVGTRTGTLTITTTAGVLVIGLTGEGLLSTPVLTLLPQPPGPLDFGSVTVGSPSSPQVVTVSNTGTGPLTFLGAPALAGDSSKASTAAKSFVIAGDFSQLATTCGATLPPPPDPLSECTATLVFTPTATGARNGTFTVASDGGIAVLDLTGQGTALPVPDISLSASGLFFPGQTVGTTSLPQPVTVSNAGTAPLVISGVSASGDFAAASDCTALSPLAPLATCGITVTFTPLAPGVRTGSVAIASSDPDTPSATVALEGDGVASPSPNATITPATLSFPSTASSQVSAPLTATLSNTGAAPLAILAIEVVGSGFTATHTCGPSLALGASCTITAIFAPPSAGGYAADVRIMTNSPAGAAFLRLTGSATAAPVGRLAAIPSTLSFGDQIVGTTSAARPFTVTNVGSAVASVSRITTTGDFAVSGTCADVRPGESCAFLAAFSPTVVGTRSGQVLFEVDGAAAPFAVGLSGNGVPVPAPRVQLSASSLAFGNGLAGVGSTLFVTVTNAGSADLVFGPLMEATGDFRVTANGCTGTLAPSQSCRIDVGFLPSIPGARSGELRFSTNAEGSPHRVALAGNGCRFEVTGRSSALVCGR